MTDFFKDVFEAAQQRIRSPFIGSVIFAFIAVNWQALFYLLFADASVADRLEHFNDGTNFRSLYVFPVCAGVAFALAMPWLRFAGAWIAVKPSSLLADLQGNEASRRRVTRLLLKAKEDEALDKANEARELRKINEEKRLKEASEAGGEALVEEIKKDREETGKQDAINRPPEVRLAERLDTLSRIIIVELARTDRRDIDYSRLVKIEEFQKTLRQVKHEATGVRLEQEVRQAISELKKLGILEENPIDMSRYGEANYIAVKLTVLGYKVHDLIAPELQYGDATSSGP